MVILKYEYPIDIQSYDYDSEEHGPIYSVKSEHVDLEVTPNHRMLVADDDTKYHTLKAEEIYGLTKIYKKSVKSLNINLDETQYSSQTIAGDFFILPSTDIK